jgi:hypothetical protein
VRASFQFGTTTAYGLSTAPQTLAPSDSGSLFSAQLTGLPAGTTIHYRAVVTSDFGTFVGADRTLRTASNPPPPPVNGRASAAHAKVSGNAASVRVSCQGQSPASCRLTLTLSVNETLRGHNLLAVTARKPPRKVHKQVIVGSADVTLQAGQSRTVQVSLNRAGRQLLAHHHPLRTTLGVTQTLANGHTVKVSTQTVVFKGAKHRHAH